MKKEDTSNDTKKTRAEQVNDDLLSLTFLAEMHRKIPDKGVEDILAMLGRKLRLDV